MREWKKVQVVPIGCGRPCCWQAIQNSYSITDCEKERNACKAERDLAQREIGLLRDQPAMKDALIAAKNEMLVLLRGGEYNKPN